MDRLLLNQVGRGFCFSARRKVLNLFPSSFAVNRGAIGKINVTGLKKPTANLMKPKNRTIGKRAAATGTKLTDKKWDAILQTTDIAALIEKSTTANKEEVPSVSVTAPVIPPTTTTTITENKKTAMKSDAKENLTAKPSKIKEPRTYDNIKDKKVKPVLVQEQDKIVAPVLRPVATVPPLLAAKTETKSAGKAPLPALVKGVRVNRRFELMMKYRNKCTKK